MTAFFVPMINKKEQPKFGTAHFITLNLMKIYLLESMVLTNLLLVVTPFWLTTT